MSNLENGKIKFNKSEMIDLLNRSFVCGYKAGNLKKVKEDFKEAFDIEDYPILKEAVFGEGCIMY